VSAGKRYGLAALAAAMLVASCSRSNAQVIPTEREVLVPPWNSVRVFEPTLPPQLTDPTMLDDLDLSDTPVKNRVWPEYEPQGIRYGSWMFDPVATAGMFYDNNVFASNANRQSDIAAQAGASLRAHTLWERHGIDVSLLSQSTLYRSHAGLDETDATFKTSGHYDIDNATTLLGSFSANYLHDGIGTLASPAGAVEPTPYSLLSGDVTLRHEFGRLSGSLGTRVDSYDFGSTVAANGTPINQDARDGQIYAAHGRLDYALSDKTGIFTALEGNRRDLQGSPGQPLGSSGYRVLSGFDMDFTHLIKGEIGGGYMSQDFTSSSIGNIQGPTYRALVTWSPTRSLDVYFNAEQIVTETSDTGSTGVLANALQSGFDYELRRNLVLSTAGTYEKETFKGQDRLDNLYAADAKLTYLMGNITSLSFWYRFTRRDSNLPNFSFDKQQVGINAAARF
jgi:hypothetical protein